MSKIGQLPISIPAGVTLEVSGSVIKIVGPKGTIEKRIPRNIHIDVKDGAATLTCKGKSKQDMSNYGTTRALINNDINGVTKGWTKQLELVGTGFRAEVAGTTLVLTVGYSHPVKIVAPTGISFKVEKTIVTVEGISRELVGQVAADIRSVRPPEPYKGKGIKYTLEVIRRKAGKAAAKTAAA